jgi:hypothetical protein
LKDAKKTSGSRPSAGNFSLIEIREAFAYLGGQATVTQLAESGLITWRDGTQKSSVKRRVRRCLSILEDAEYVSGKIHPQDRRKTLYVTHGLSDLRIPGDEEWNQTTRSLRKLNENNRGTEGSSGRTG